MITIQMKIALAVLVVTGLMVNRDITNVYIQRLLIASFPIFQKSVINIWAVTT